MHEAAKEEKVPNLPAMLLNQAFVINVLNFYQAQFFYLKKKKTRLMGIRTPPSHTTPIVTFFLNQSFRIRDEDELWSSCLVCRKLWILHLLPHNPGTCLQSQHLGGGDKEDGEFTTILGYITSSRPSNPVFCETISQMRKKNKNYHSSKWSIGVLQIISLSDI